MSDEKQLDKRLEKSWQIHKILCDCESIDLALTVGVDALAIFVNSQFDTPTERRVIIAMCIERLQTHIRHADKF